MGMPVIRQLRILGSLIRRDGTLGADGEMDPTVAVRAPAYKASVVPPGAHQRVVYCASMVFQSEINRLHRLPATSVRTSRLGVDDVRCLPTFLAHLSVHSVHLAEFVCRRCRGIVQLLAIALARVNHRT